MEDSTMGHWYRGKALSIWLVILALSLSADLLGSTGAPKAGANNAITELASPGNIVQFVRDRFEIPESAAVNAQVVRPTGLPHFYQTVVTVDDGKQKRALNAFITDDGQCFALGSLFALEGATVADIVKCVRQATALPGEAKVTVGAFAATPFRNFLRSTVTVELGTQTQKGDLYVSRDRRVGILGLALPFRRDFVQSLIDTRNQPSVGPPDARVTIVEYADLECLKCALFQKFLETEFLPKYNPRVRVVFKEFPLYFHTWSTMGAVANECAYQLAASSFLPYRSMIYSNQPTINSTNVRERLLDLGEQAGLDRARLGMCLDSKASLGRVDYSRHEGEILGVNGTPTFAINGRVVVDFTPSSFYKEVDEALAAAHNQH